MKIPVLILLSAVVAGCGGSALTTTTTTIPESTTAGPTTTSSLATTTVAEPIVLVFYGVESPVTCSEVIGYERTAAGSVDPITGAFDELLKGPIAEERAVGASSFFSEATEGMLNEVSLSGIRLSIDFADFSSVIPNASSSCGSAALLAQLTTTAFQFHEVNEVTYSFDGDCEAFGAFLQMGCIVINRSDWPPSQ